jgi:hypothetical protein
MVHHRRLTRPAAVGVAVLLGACATQHEHGARNAPETQHPGRGESQTTAAQRSGQGTIGRARTPDGAAPRATDFSPTGRFWVSNQGHLLEVRGVAGYVEASIGQAFKQAFLFSFTNKMAVIARGQKARLRLGADPGAVYTRLDPSEIGVVRFTVQPDDDRRYIWVVSRVGSNQGEFYPSEDDMKFDDEEVAPGVYKLKVRSDLVGGEYGLIAPGGNTGYVVYDFAIE